MKKYTLIVLSLICLLSACGKKDKFLAISGIQLKDENNNYMGDMGKPGDLDFYANVKLNAFPVPATNNILNVMLDNNSGESLSFTLELKAAYYRDAPRKLTEGLLNFRRELVGSKIKVENLNGDPDKNYISREFVLAAGEREAFMIDVSHFPQGFYKILLHASNGQTYHVGAWVFRP